MYKNYVKNNTTGELHTLIKNKPVNVPVKGRIKLELYNAETGEVEVEAKSENIFMNWPYKNAYNAGVFGGASRRKRAGASDVYDNIKLPNLIGTLRLTTNTLPEHADCPLVLGKQIGWSPLDYTYAGSDTQKGTLNTAETRHYWNDQGQYVMSMVCDWPTHASNGTFQSIFITYDEDVNHTNNLHSGQVICNLQSVPTEYKKAFKGGSARWAYRYNEDLDELIVIGFNGNSHDADYGRRINIFRFDGKHGGYKSFTQLKDADGVPISAYFYDYDYFDYTDDANSNNINHPHNFHYITTDEFINVCYDGSKLIRRTYNSEGIYKNDEVSVNLTDITDGNNGRLYVNHNTTAHNRHCSAFRIYGDGTIHLYGNFKPKDDVYENVIVIFNKDLEIQNIVYVNDKLYPDWVLQSPSARYWQSERSHMHGRHIFRMSTGAGSFTYLITKDGDIQYLSDNSYHGGVIGGDYSISGINMGDASTVGRQSYRYNRLSTHTLLASPITKTQSHTMKITYEVISEPTNIVETQNFIDAMLSKK